MVAETVKFPVSYPALLPLSPSIAGLGYNTCSNALLHQPSYQPHHPMDTKPIQHHQHHQQHQSQPQHSPQPQGSQVSQNREDTPVGLGAPGLNLPSLELAAQMHKKDMFSQRKQREFIPENKKDESYWDRRRRNNEAAKRSREKRRFNDMILEQRVVELVKENHVLKAQLSAIKDKYGILGESLVNSDQVMASMPQPDQILNKRTKFSPSLITLGSPPSVTSLLSPDGSCASSPPPSGHYQDDGLYPSYAPTSQSDDHENFDSVSQHYPPTSASELYYGQSALNLSARTSSSSSSSHSPASPAPSTMDYSPSDPELLRRSPVGDAGGSSLPHKLRHKSHLGDKDAAAQSLLALHGIKTEPHDGQHEAADDSPASSDERDSGISYASSSPDYHRGADNSAASPAGSRGCQASQYPHQNQHHTPHHTQAEQDPTLEYENTHLRSELERLASEVATLKYMFGRRPRSETDSDGSR